MKYLGSKRRIANEILPVILKNRKEGQWYVEPFCGGCNLIDQVENPRLANDSNLYLISFCQALANGWLPPDNISEEKYNEIKNSRDNFAPHLVGYVGFQLSFGAKWFGGYRRDKVGKRNYPLEAYQNVKKQQPLLNGIVFRNVDYQNLGLPEKSIVYCDPPYENVTKYKDEFNHTEYWRWIRKIVLEGHSVFCSEYNAPDDFAEIWSKEVVTGVDVVSVKKDTEKLFVHKSQLA